MPDALLLVRVGHHWLNPYYIRYAWDNPTEAVLTLCFGESNYVTCVALERLRRLAYLSRHTEEMP